MGRWGGGLFIYYSAQKVKLHSMSQLALLPVYYSKFVNLAPRVCLNIFFTLDMPADLCLTGLQISTNQRATRKQFWGSIHSRAFRQTNYTCV